MAGWGLVRHAGHLHNTGDQFNDDFESGSLTTNWPTRVGAVSATADAARTGAFGCRIAPAGAAAQIATSTIKWTQLKWQWAYLRLALRFNAFPASGTADLITIQNNIQTNNFDLFLDDTGVFRGDLQGSGSGGAFFDLFEPELDKWYVIQAKVFYGDTTYIAQYKVGGVTSGLMLDGGETAGFVRSLHFGTGSAKTYSFDIDNVHLRATNTEPRFR